MDLCEFEASLVYRVISRTARATQENLSQEMKKQKQNKTCKQEAREKATLKLAEMADACF